MKKSGSKRGSYDSGLSSAVLDAPEESFALKGATVSGGWMGRGPAPTGALQRGYGEPEGYGGPGVAGLEEPEYRPRRGSFRLRVGGLPKSVAGRIVLGVVVFLALSAVVVAVGGMRYFLMHDARFLMATSADVQIVGDEHLSRGEVLSVFAGDLERNIFRVPLAERRADLERLPWVSHATVMRLLPNKIRVSITERTPVAFVRQGTQIGLVDASGVLLDMPAETAGDPHYSFPVLTGLSANDPLSTRAARMEVYRQFMQELDGTGDRLTNSLSEVDVSNPEDVKALVASGSSDVLVHFGDEAFLARYKEFEKNLPEWKQQYPKLASADMRYEGQIVLEMQGGASVPAAAEAGAPVDGNVVKATMPVVEAAPVASVVKPKPFLAKAVGKPVPVDLGVAKPKGVVEAVPVDLGTAKPAVVKASAVKPKAVAVKPAVGKKAAKTSAKGKGAKSASNEKMFAALAAAQKARAAKSGVTP